MPRTHPSLLRSGPAELCLGVPQSKHAALLTVHAAALLITYEYDAANAPRALAVACSTLYMGVSTLFVMKLYIDCAAKRYDVWCNFLDREGRNKQKVTPTLYRLAFLRSPWSQTTPYAGWDPFAQEVVKITNNQIQQSTKRRYITASTVQHT